MVLHGTASDHRAVRLKIALSSVKFKAHAISQGTIDWPKILSDDHTHMMYNEHLLSLPTPNMGYDDYREIILFEGWFQISRTTIAPLLKECNQVLHATNCAHHLLAAIQHNMQVDLQRLN
jgi:hypothetical protein